MNPLLSRMSPSVTNMIRMDHTHVLTTFHQYHPDTPLRVKKGLADTVCLALEIHAQLEEEIFYPALLQVGLANLIFVWGALSVGIEVMTPVLFVFLIYLFQTTGELCLSPVGLSAMNRLAPCFAVAASSDG